MGFNLEKAHVEQDRHRVMSDTYLKELGFQVLHFENCQVENTLSNVISKIKDAIRDCEGL